MAKKTTNSAGNYFDQLRSTRVWQSIFRSGTGSSTLHRALAIQQNIFLHLFSTKVRTRMASFSTTWYLGTLTFGTFLILVATGIPLMFYYHPSVPQAYADTKDFQFVVSSGMFLRNLHRWSAHAMVFLVFAHMFKVFYRGAYRTPREFNWVIGVFLLLITLLLSYTGYLLPWDQLAFWAITVGSNIASAVPVLGNKVHFMMLGGNSVNANALLRFYVLHCMILPLIAMLFVAVHFWRIRKDGGLYAHHSEPTTIASKTTAAQETREVAG
jgi:quinol-cytochrome oxidoreductase complex cytochrome b subunit